MKTKILKNPLPTSLVTAISLAFAFASAEARAAAPDYASGEVATSDEAASSDFTRLSYYVHPGKLYFAPDLEWTPTDTSTPQRNGGPLSSSSAHSWLMDATLTYGLPYDGLRFGISESWQIHRWTNTTGSTTGDVRQTDSSGFSDPTFQLQYRYLDSKPFGFAGDFSLSVSPGWGDHEIATTPSSGNDDRGYGLITFGTSLYRITAQNDLGLSASLTHDFSGSGVDQSVPASSYTRDSTWTEVLSVSDRYHFTNNFYGQIGANFDFAYTSTETNSAATPTATTFQIPFHMNPNLLVGYRFRDKLTLDAIMTYQNYTTTSTTSTPPETDTQTIENTFELRGRMEF